MIAKLGLASAGFALLLCATLCLSQASEDKRQEFSAHMQKAHGYLDEKQPLLAIPEFQAAVAIDPENVDAQANLGVLLFFQGKAADSIPHFRAALARQPGLAKIQGLLGMAESRTLDFANARKGVPMKEALASEIIEAYQGQGNAIRKRDEVHKMAQANKAFAHFRW